jgi:predicted component of type VI protein secretion system
LGDLRKPSSSLALFHRFNFEINKQLIKDEEFIVNSIIAEVTLLLNTRSSLSIMMMEKIKKIPVIYYGMPDFIHLSPVNNDDLAILNGLIWKTIAENDRRLKIKKIDIESPRTYRNLIKIMVYGRVDMDKKNWDINFPVQIGILK